MGYRSNGLWVIEGPVDKVIAAWAAIKLTLPPPATNSASFNDFDIYKSSGVGYIRFEYEGWKWYSDYEDVKWYESIWDALRDGQWGLNGARVRIGEEDDDIERDAFGSDAPWISVLRSIDFNGPYTGEPITQGEPHASTCIQTV